MDKLIYLFLLLILFVNSINTKLMLVSIFCFVGICVFYKKHYLLIFGLIILYILSLFNQNKKKETFTNHLEESISTLSTKSESDSDSDSDSDSESDSDSDSEQNVSYSFDNSQQETPIVIDKYDELVLTKKTYSKLSLILRSLLDKTYLENNKESIDNVIDKFNIKDIFSLSDSIINKDSQVKYDNFLEKITCIKDNNVNYLDCNNKNYEKLKIFSELIRIYTFSIEFVLKLINEYKVRRLCDVENHLKVLINNGKYGYEYNGYMVYVNKFSINDKYYKLLELLDLDKKLTNQNTNIPLKERLYNYVDENTKVSKELNSLVVMFDYYKILDDVRLFNEEDDYEWDYSVLRNIELNKNYWDISFFKDYKIKELIINKINELTKDDKNIFKHQLNEKYKKISDNKKIKQQSDNAKDEYKIVEDKYDKKESQEFLEKLNLKNIKENFTKVFLEIIDEIHSLYDDRCKKDCKNKDSTFLNTCMYYSSNILKLSIKNGRMFYIGLFIIFISLMLYFIDASK